MAKSQIRSGGADLTPDQQSRLIQELQKGVTPSLPTEGAVPGMVPAPPLSAYEGMPELSEAMVSAEPTEFVTPSAMMPEEQGITPVEPVQGYQMERPPIEQLPPSQGEQLAQDIMSELGQPSPVSGMTLEDIINRPIPDVSGNLLDDIQKEQLVQQQSSIDTNALARAGSSVDYTNLDSLKRAFKGVSGDADLSVIRNAGLAVATELNTFGVRSTPSTAAQSSLNANNGNDTTLKVLADSTGASPQALVGGIVNAFTLSAMEAKRRADENEAEAEGEGELDMSVFDEGETRTSEEDYLKPIPLDTFKNRMASHLGQSLTNQANQEGRAPRNIDQMAMGDIMHAVGMNSNLFDVHTKTLNDGSQVDFVLPTDKGIRLVRAGKKIAHRSMCT